MKILGSFKQAISGDSCNTAFIVTVIRTTEQGDKLHIVFFLLFVCLCFFYQWLDNVLDTVIIEESWKWKITACIKKITAGDFFSKTFWKETK